MNTPARPFDVIILGATGFTGQQASGYLAKNFPASLRWAVSGRSPEKLALLQQTLSSTLHPPSAQFVVDHQNEKVVREVVAQAKVVLNFAGPFARYGNSVVAACAELGTHYLDITGEIYWVRKMIDQHEASAQKSGAILIPFSGFDSVPSDWGVSEVLTLAKKNHPQRAVTQVVSSFSMRGGINGGTFETFMDMLEQGAASDPAVLVPPAYQKRFPFKENRHPVFLKEQGATLPPFFMAPINTAVVYRSQALRMAAEHSSATPFEYLELQNLSGELSKLKSWATVATAEVLQQVGRHSLGRTLLRKLGPLPGQGPSAQVRETGFFKARFFAYAQTQLLSRYEISFTGDPGNKATVALICESARCLIFDSEQLAQIRGGFWTPSTALGSVLGPHLISAGFKSTEPDSSR
jgi:short subunit dehydrogenase-like uncharacterized protein